MEVQWKALLARRSTGAGAIGVAKLAEIAAVLASPPPHQEERERRMDFEAKSKSHPSVVRKVTLMTLLELSGSGLDVLLTIETTMKTPT